MHLVKQREFGGCGIAVMATVLGVDLKEVECRASRVTQVDWKKYGLTDEEVVNILRHAGMNSVRRELDWPSFDVSAILVVPSLNRLGLLHYVIWDAEAEQYLDPAQGPLFYPDDGPVIANEIHVCWASCIRWD